MLTSLCSNALCNTPAGIVNGCLARLFSNTVLGQNQSRMQELSLLSFQVHPVLGRLTGRARLYTIHPVVCNTYTTSQRQNSSVYQTAHFFQAEPSHSDHSPALFKTPGWVTGWPRSDTGCSECSRLICTHLASAVFLSMQDGAQAAAPVRQQAGQEVGIPEVGCSKCRYRGCTKCRAARQKAVEVSTAVLSGIICQGMHYSDCFSQHLATRQWLKQTTTTVQVLWSYLPMF